jgi:CHAT domain-containing protein
MRSARTAALVVVMAVVLGAQADAGQVAGVEASVQTLISQARTLSADGGRHDEALVILDRAMALVLDTSDREGQARVQMQRGVAYRALSRRSEASRVLLEARDLSVGTSFSSVAVQALNLLATLATEADDLEQADEWLRQARPIAEASGNRAVYASLLESLGRSARARGRPEEAIQYASDAIKTAEEGGDYLVVARALGARSTALLGLGRLDDALVDAERAYALAAERAPRMRSSTLFSLAQAHAHVWNLERAADLWTQAIESYRTDNLQIGVALATRQRMDTWSAMGEYDKAAADGQAALAMMAQTGSAGARPGLLARLALIESQRGDATAAADYATAAKRTAMHGPDRRFLDNDLGLVALRTGDLAGASASFQSVLDVATLLPDPEYQWRGHYGLGRVAQAEGRLDAAAMHHETAVTLIERMRRDLPEAGLRAAFLSDRTIAYDALVSVRLADTSTGDQETRARRALEIAERARSRSLADLLAESQRRLTDPSLEEIRSQERRSSERLAILQKHVIAAADPDVRRVREAELSEAEREHEAMVVRVRRDNPAYAGLVYPEPLTAAALAAVPRVREVLVEFQFDGDAGGHAWLIAPGSVLSYDIPDAESLETSIRLLGSLISANDTEGVSEVGGRLYEQLFGPVRAQLREADRVVMIPSGPLHRLPWSTLRPTPGRWFFDDHALSLAPSVTVLAELRRRDRLVDAARLLAFAATPQASGDRRGNAAADVLQERTRGLAHADAEVRDVARLLSAYGVRWNGAARSEAELKQASGDYRVLHFATHAVIDETVPRRSAILLDESADEDGLLQLNEIPNLSLRAELVVLAACRSQLGRRLSGEGLQSLSRAFIRAGSQAVLATLWEVDDALTRRFMGEFYQALSVGVPADVALRTAQQQVINEGGPVADPAVWAAFVLNGDGSQPLLVDVDSRLGWWFALAALAGLAGWRYSTRKRRVGVV